MKLIRFLFAATIGMVYGLMFAQRPGKDLRKELKKSKEPYKILFNECKEADLEALDEVTHWAKESEDLQRLLKTGQVQFDDFVQGAKRLSSEGREIATKKLEELSKEAQSAAKELKKTAIKKGSTLKKDIGKEVKTMAKKIKK